MWPDISSQEEKLVCSQPDVLRIRLKNTHPCPAGSLSNAARITAFNIRRMLSAVDRDAIQESRR